MIEPPTLVVMAKAPRLGFGKTRLAAELGASEALRINRRMHAATLRAACDVRWRTILYVTPDWAVRARIAAWPRFLARCAQGGGDLGQRLARALAGKRWVAAIGTDCPALSRRHIASAFAALKRAPFALGPAEDGGFWLLAAREGDAAAKAMEGVRWSSPHAASDVIARLGAGKVALLARLRDVDTAADLRR
jgi:rSAM/selenodomain-associated transferase 1